MHIPSISKKMVPLTRDMAVGFNLWCMSKCISNKVGYCSQSCHVQVKMEVLVLADKQHDRQIVIDKCDIRTKCVAKTIRNLLQIFS